jgi:para-aminobenzoate synthetase/4-amino-4-deoxychorismate lyase
MPGSQAGKPYRVRFAAQPVDSKDLFLYHKTTQRKRYQNALAAAPGSDDVLLWNEAEEVTESSIGNLVVEMDGELYTPPLSCGLLPGVFREWLLRQGAVKERVGFTWSTPCEACAKWNMYPQIS